MADVHANPPKADLIFLSHMYESLGFLETCPEELVESALELRDDPDEALALAAAYILREYERRVVRKYA
jgi:hypothetical protein